MVGDAAGIDSRSAELFVPDVDGRVVSNNELEDMVAGDEGTNEIDNLLSGLEDSSGTQSSSSLPPSSSGGGISLEGEKKSVSEIKGVKTSRSDIAIMPMSKRTEFNFKSPKKIKKTIIISRKNNMSTQQPSMPTGKSKTFVIMNQSSQKTLLDLQSIVLSSG